MNLQEIVRTAGLVEPSVHDEMPFKLLLKWMKSADPNASKDMAEYGNVDSDESDEEEVQTADGKTTTVKKKKSMRTLVSELAVLAPSQTGDGPPLLRVIGASKVSTIPVKQRQKLRKSSPMIRGFAKVPRTLPVINELKRICGGQTQMLTPQQTTGIEQMMETLRKSGSREVQEAMGNFVVFDDALRLHAQVEGGITQGCDEFMDANELWSG